MRLVEVVVVVVSRGQRVVQWNGALMKLEGRWRVVLM